MSTPSSFSQTKQKCVGWLPIFFFSFFLFCLFCLKPSIFLKFHVFKCQLYFPALSVHNVSIIKKERGPRNEYKIGIICFWRYCLRIHGKCWKWQNRLPSSSSSPTWKTASELTVNVIVLPLLPSSSTSYHLKYIVVACNTAEEIE